MATFPASMGRLNDTYEYLYSDIQSIYKQDHLQDIIRAAQKRTLFLGNDKEIQQFMQNR